MRRMRASEVNWRLLQQKHQLKLLSREKLIEIYDGICEEYRRLVHCKDRESVVRKYVAFCKRRDKSSRKVLKALGVSPEDAAASAVLHATLTQTVARGSLSNHNTDDDMLSNLGLVTAALTILNHLGDGDQRVRFDIETSLPDEVYSFLALAAKDVATCKARKNVPAGQSGRMQNDGALMRDESTPVAVPPGSISEHAAHARLESPPEKIAKSGGARKKARGELPQPLTKNPINKAWQSWQGSLASLGRKMLGIFYKEQQLPALPPHLISPQSIGESDAQKQKALLDQTPAGEERPTCRRRRGPSSSPGMTNSLSNDTFQTCSDGDAIDMNAEWIGERTIDSHELQQPDEDLIAERESSKKHKEEAAISTRTRSQVSQRNLKRPLDSPPDLQTRPKVAVITRAGTRQARSKEPGACADQAVADGTQSRQKNAAVEKEDPLTLENKHVTVDPSVCSAGNIVMDTDTNADGVTARQAAGPLVHAEPEAQERSRSQMQGSRGFGSMRSMYAPRIRRRLRAAHVAAQASIYKNDQEM